MESDEVENYKLPSFPNPFILCTKLVSLQAEIVASCIVGLASPFFSVISLVSEFFRRAPPEPKEDFQPVSSAATVARGGSLLLGRIAMGLLAAAYVCMVLIIVMVVAAVLGVGLVRAWAEEPVYVRESLQFDYTNAHPTAVFSFGNRAGVPVGHTLYVSLVLLMPDSDYNRDIGIFQVKICVNVYIYIYIYISINSISFFTKIIEIVFGFYIINGSWILVSSSDLMKLCLGRFGSI